MIAQMAATAGSVAIGSTIGHGLSSMLFGGGGQAAPAQEAPASGPPVQQQQASGISCEPQAKGGLFVVMEWYCFLMSFGSFRIHEVPREGGPSLVHMVSRAA